MQHQADRVARLKGEFYLMPAGKDGNALFDSLFSPYPEVLPDRHFLKSYGH